jgi:RNA polymerase sigma-70 factor (ECF subfamily)
MEALSTMETAQMLDVTEDVVKTRLHRARLALRQKLDEYLRAGSSRRMRWNLASVPKDARNSSPCSLAYLDLEFPAEACREIETHLAGCPPSIEFAASLRKTVELCRRYQPSELPEPIGNDAREQLLSAYRKMLSSRLLA